MSKLLTISIPTYNRAQALDRQLMWLATEILGHEDDCEIIISDDCSTDNTDCLLYTSPSPRDGLLSRMPSSA